MKTKQCFVIMPFSKTNDKHTEEYWTQFFDVIKSEINRLGFDCVRSETGPYNMIKQIIQKINDSDLVIAVLTDLNPNVWYELGIRHSLKNNTLMLIEDGQRVPFDISSYGLVKYSDNISLSTKLHHEFSQYTDKLLNDKNCDSPVIDSLGFTSHDHNKLDLMYDLILKLTNEKSNTNKGKSIQKNNYNRILWVDDFPSNNAQVISFFEDKINFDIAISTV